jgi:hypothetical protein
VKIEGKLAVVLDREEDNPGVPDEIDQQILDQDVLPKIVPRSAEALEAANGCASLHRSDGVGEEGSA